MALNIKNETVERLAARLAQLSGESKTQAVLKALEERLERLSGEREAPDLLSDILDISMRCAQLPDQDERSPEKILGYDQQGTFEDGD